jgi:hypothetical protein
MYNCNIPWSGIVVSPWAHSGGTTRSTNFRKDESAPKGFFVCNQMNNIKEIPGYEGYYAISKDARVFSLERTIFDKNGKAKKIKFKELKQKNQNGYMAVHFRKENTDKIFLVHRLLMIAFVENKDNKEYVNHIDGNKSNNRLSNLEWCTAAENTKHAIDVLKVKPSMLGKTGINHKRSRKVMATNVKTGEKIYFDALMDAKRAGFKASEVCSCCRGLQKTHYGMKWQYV